MRTSIRTRLGALLAALATLAALLTTTATTPAAAAPPDGPDPLANFDVALPNGWFTYNGASTVAAAPQTVGATDPLARPGQLGDNGVLVATFDVVDFGGFGQDLNDGLGAPQDWSTTSGFRFWFKGTGSGLAYQAEISDNRSNPAADTSERFDYTFIDNSTEWRLIDIAWSDFTRATDFQPGGAPDDGLTLTEVWSWAIVLPLGADTVAFDDVAPAPTIIDDFESGLPTGTDANGVPVGFYTFSGADSSATLSTPAASTPVPGQAEGNRVLAVDLDVSAFAGFIHAFTNDTADTWVPQDWSASKGLSVWIKGTGSGTNLFLDVLDNRNPGSTVDDAERWTVELVDDFEGWQYFEFPFTSFVRKGVGNNAPNDDFGLTEVHGWAFGSLGTPGPITIEIDTVALYGVAEQAELAVSLATNNFDVNEGDSVPVTIKLSRPLGEGDPASVSVDYAVTAPVAEAGIDYEPVADGTVTFTAGGPIEQSFTVQSLDDTKYEPTERLIVRLSNPTDIVLGSVLQASVSIIDNDDYDPLLLDDFESEPYFWDATAPATIDQRFIAPGDADAQPDQTGREGVADVTTPVAVEAQVAGPYCRSDRTSGDGASKGKGPKADRSNKANQPVIVTVFSSDSFDATTIDASTLTLGEATEIHDRVHAEDVNDDGRNDIVAHFDADDVNMDCGAVIPLNGFTTDGVAFTAGGSDASVLRDFPIGQNWTEAQALTFWYYGSGQGDQVTVDLADNRAADPGPAGWDTVWADEFNEPAGTPPNPDNWGYELGDGTVNGIPGWGNSELQYYTDSPDNAATDGEGNLVITLTESDNACYYGECDYDSARLVTTNRAEFAYGRIEARVEVPDGGAGLWPAVWSLGTDIDRVGWPQTGEIDIMEYVSRIPDEIFGTIHGPGYSGGNAYGDTQAFPEGVAGEYHTFTIEWQPDRIDWFVDGIAYHTATPADVAPNEWVFNDPVYLLMNFAIGGNFGGPVADDLTLPQTMKVDYVRVEQAPDTAERFEASFTDDTAGWRQVTIPFDAFMRSADQPEGAPDDGLTLSEVWGYGFSTPAGTATGSFSVDQVRLLPVPPPTAITVTSAADGGDGSLRRAIERLAPGGTITVDPALAGQTIALTSGPLVVAKDLTIDASAAPGLTIDGQGRDRVLVVDAVATATVTDLTLTRGYGFQLAGCVLNNGTLTLARVAVTDCVMTTDAGDFWQGGGAIYTGGGATLNLVASTVAGNTSGWSGGGLYGFFDSTTTITDSTIANNTATDVGGGIRMLGDATITNSTLSANNSTAWHGGAVFHTDGVMDLVNVTVADNTAPAGTATGLFVGTFTASSPTLSMANTIVGDSTGAGAGPNCFAGYFGAGTVTLASNGHNLATDGSCALGAPGDQPNTATGLAPLADNGGPTLTHALTEGSAAIDAANPDLCPATDQRGATRVGVCDIGSYEFGATP